MGQNWAKNNVFWIYRAISSLIFSQFGLWWKFILSTVFLHKPHVWEKSGSWDMDQNALGQSDCRIFKSTISLEQNNQKAWFLACWYKFMEIKIWLKIIGVDMVKNGCGQLGHRTLKLAVTQEGNNGINWFLMCLYKFRKAKSYFNNFRIKNGCGLLGHETLKSAVSQELIAEISWFFKCWYKFRTAKSYFNNYLVGMAKSEWDLLDYGTINSSASQNDLLNWADWLNDFCMLILMIK